MEALECIRTRRSVRQFLEDPIEESVLRDIADCGRLAATAINIQPVHIVVVTDKTVKSKIANATDHGKFLASAPACMLVISEDVKYFLEDGSATTQNILLAARAHGLGSCWIAGDKKPYAEDICKTVGAPEGYKLVSIVALGKPATVADPSKKSLEQVVHWEKF